MKINHLNSISKQNFIFQNNSMENRFKKEKGHDILNFLAASPATISFQATKKIPLKPLKINNPTNEVLVNKIKNIILNTKAGSEFPTRILDVNGEKLGYYINKKENSDVEVIIKNLVSNIDEFKKTKNNQSELKFIVDKDGLLKTARLTKKINESFTKIFDFRKETPLKSTVRMNEGIVIRQSRTDENLWNTRPDLCKYRMDKTFDITKDFNDIALADIFFELSKRNTSLLA